MDNLEKHLWELKKVDPSTKFLKHSKTRLMSQIEMDSHEQWFVQFLKKVAPVNPRAAFKQSARIRLIERISAVKQPLFSWLGMAKRLAASTLVMMLAVTSTLFFVQGRQAVSADEEIYLQVTSGQATVKHADRLIWDVITDEVQLSAGDLIRLGDASSATVHFFDDSQLRLSENSLLLLSRLAVSPGDARQGVIEVSLHQGKAWAQTLNTNDGYANFTLITDDAIVSARNASFDVQTRLFEPTQIRAFRHGLNVRALERDTREVAASTKLNSGQQITVEALGPAVRTTDLALVAPVADMTNEVDGELWVSRNLMGDQKHLLEVRQAELAQLKSATGSLPGNLLYPLKRAKERLSLAFRLKGEGQINTQINIANQRLSEAIVLIEKGESERAQLALIEYQALVRQIVEAQKQAVVNKQAEPLSKQVVNKHQKTLVAALPGDAKIGLVKKVLDETEEFLAEDPIEKTEIRLENKLENLVQVQDLIEAGDLTAAKEVLVSAEILSTTLLDQAEAVVDDEQKRSLYAEVLAAQYEEQRILADIAKRLAEQSPDHQLVALVESADRHLNAEIERTIAVVKPVLPDVVLSAAVTLPADTRVREFVDKVNIYSSWTGQKNQISRLLKQHPQYARDMDFLTEVQSYLDDRAADYVNTYIHNLKREQVELKGKRVKRKIDRARRLHKVRSSQ